MCVYIYIERAKGKRESAHVHNHSLADRIERVEWPTHLPVSSKEGTTPVGESEQ